MYLTTQLFGRRIGTVGGILWALYPPAIFFDLIVQKTSLASALTCGFLVVLMVGLKNRKVGPTYWGGLLLGLLVLTRENALVWLPVALFALVVVHRARATWPGIAMIVGFSCAIAPAVMHNFVTGGDLSISTFQAGPNFYIGNRSGANGRYAPLVRGHETPEFERLDATRLAEAATGKALDAKEVSAYWFERARAEIAADPWDWIRLLGWKALLVLNAHEVSDVECFYVYRDNSLILSTIGPLFHWGTLLPLAAIGIHLNWYRKGAWKLLPSLWIIMAATIVAFYIMARYRFPLAPAMIPPAAFACFRVSRSIREKRWGEMKYVWITAIVFGVIANLPLVNSQRLIAMAHMNVGVAYAKQQKLDRAETVLLHAYQQFPDSADIAANLAQVLALEGQFEQATTFYEKAMQLEPGLPNLFYNAAVAYEKCGKKGVALSYYKLALQENPEDSATKGAIERLLSE